MRLRCKVLGTYDRKGLQGFRRDYTVVRRFIAHYIIRMSCLLFWFYLGATGCLPHKEYIWRWIFVLRPAINPSPLSDNGFEEFPKDISEPKYYHDKRKVAAASEAAPNDIIEKNFALEYKYIHVLYIICFL